MKVLEKNLKKGIVKLVPQSVDDLWHLYNIIYENDRVYAYTSREIKPDKGGYGRPERGERVSVFLGVRVEKVFWDKLLGRLRVNGRISEAPEIVPAGVHHTLDVSLNSPITIVKDKWSRHHLERLERARRASEKPLTIIAIDDEGFAVATTAEYGIDVRAEETMRLPGKLEPEKRTAATRSYFKRAADSLRNVWAMNRSPIVVIGVGYIKNEFAKFLQSEEADLNKSVADVKSVNNGGVAGIHEALRSGVLSKATRQQRVEKETQVVEEALKRLGKSQTDVAYGLEEVEKVDKIGAVEMLILADVMLREASDEKRLQIEELMASVEQKGGSFMVISTEHEAGAKLLALSGVVALLRFAVSQT